MSDFSFRTPVAPAGTTPGDRPTFSIIIAAYQAAETIPAAIESALAQTHPAAEIIVCDDGSEDDLDGALAPYRDRLTLIRQKNSGAAAARNTAAEAASGEFVVILDADDTYLPRRLEGLTELARVRPDLDLLTTDAFFVAGGARVGRFYGATPFATEHQRSEILRWCFVGGWPAIRRDRLLAAGGFDAGLARSSDWDCWMRLIFDGSSAGLVDAPLMEYRLTPQGLSFSRAESLESRVTVLRKNLAHLSLSEREHQLAGKSLKLHTARAAVARELQGVANGDVQDVRRRTRRLAFASGLPPRMRLRAAAAWVQPSRAEHWLGEARPLADRLDAGVPQ